MSNVIVIVGNGFNYMVSDFILAEYDNNIDLFTKFTENEIEDLCNDVYEITGLWKKFEQFFQDLIHEYEYTPEELIKMIYLVLEFLANIDNVSKLVTNAQQYMNYFKEGLNECIADRIFEISEKFRRFEIDGGYSNIGRVFPNIGKKIKEIIEENNISQSYFVTTNYDGILDTLLCVDGRFWFADGFGNDREGRKVYSEYNFEKNHLSVHIHGSYRFFYDGFQVIKLPKGKENKNPVMIFNQPEYKKRQIMNHDILREYYYELESRLINSNRIIIIGNSLRCEPHLINLIDKNFNKQENILHIYDKYPEKVKGQLEDNMSDIKFTVDQICTDRFETMDELLENISKITEC